VTVVSVSELKAHLSRYIHEVRRGGEVQIVDRGRPVARLVAACDAAGETEASLRSRLVATGILRAGNGRTNEILNEAPPHPPLSLETALEEDRDDRL
jgi:prevent-host-death family protein